MRTPRMRLSCARGSPMSSWPSNLMLPCARPLPAKRPMTDMKIWLLPEPDSPTMPTASPGLIAKLTSLTAFTSPSGVAKVVSRWRTSRMRASLCRSAMISAVFRVERVPEAVADEVEAKQGDRQERRGEEQHPGSALHVLDAVGDQGAPAGQRLLHAKAEEGEEALGQNRLRNRQR